MSEQADQSVWPSLTALWSALDRGWRRRFWGLMVVSLVASAGEILSIGSLLPFLSVLTDPSGLSRLPLIGSWIEPFDPRSELPGSYSIISLGIIFGLMVLLASMVRWWLAAACAHFAYQLGGVLGQTIFRAALFQPYAFHLRTTSSEIIDVVATRVQMVVSSVLMSGLQLTTSLIMVTAIGGLLVWLDPVLAPIALTGFTVVYVVIYYIRRKRLKLNSRLMSEVGAKRYQLLQEGIGGIRDIHLDASQDHFVQAFVRADNAFRDAQSQNAIASASPRYLVEGLGTLLLATLAVVYAIHSAGAESGATSVASLVPILGVLVLAAQRLLPLLQQIYAGCVSIRGMTHTLNLVTQWLQLPVTATPFPSDQQLMRKPIRFVDRIELRDVVFSYQSGTKPVLNDLSLIIQKGQSIGLCGATGEGKSTLLDVLMGLLEPQAGGLLVDGQSIYPRINELTVAAWQAQIAHVPQQIYLADTSIAGNVAFGVAPDKIDFDRVRSALEAAHLLSYVDSLSQGLQTFVGERGIRLSGGQRQRIGIARALYKGAKLLVCDEATSALDPSTEQAIVQTLTSLKPELTLVMVSHRPSALRHCDVVYQLAHGKLTVVIS